MFRNISWPTYDRKSDELGTLTLPTDISAIMKQNFVYRMLFRDIY